ncbi:MAG: pitrilysin family protein [Parvularculales bacterium]
MSMVPLVFLKQSVVTAAVLLSLTGTAHAVDIQRIVSPGGIEAWLVEDYSVPLIALRAAWDRGWVADPSDKVGLTNLGINLLWEGAGDYDATEFQEQVEGLNIRLRVSAGRDNIQVGLEILVENQNVAFGLLRLALTDPRFDDDAIGRVRDQIVTSIRWDEQNPGRIANQEWFKAYFGDHPYGRDGRGTEESLATLQKFDLKVWHQEALTRDNLYVVVVGAIDADSLKPILDDVFGGLPATAPPLAVTNITHSEPRTIVVPLDTAQTAITYGALGLKLDDPDFLAAFVMNYILGDAGLSSRLIEELREKRGIVYEAYSYLSPFDQEGVFIGFMATENDNVSEAMTVVRDELARIAEEGVSKEELNDAKTYLTGAYPLRFTSNIAIADQLIGIRVENLGIDYVARRNDMVNAVSLDDIQRAAQRILGSGDLTVVMVGAPEGVSGSTP